VAVARSLWHVVCDVVEGGRSTVRLLLAYCGGFARPLVQCVDAPGAAKQGLLGAGMDD
jgi:hypothetical protein